MDISELNIRNAVFDAFSPATQRKFKHRQPELFTEDMAFALILDMLTVEKNNRPTETIQNQEDKEVEKWLGGVSLSYGADGKTVIKPSRV